jgi:uncharacterized caspase-like protein
MRRALVIGINEYEHVSRLFGCVRDATAVASTLATNGDGSPNFDARLLTSDHEQVTAEAMDAAIHEVFAADADVALLYFAGHGALSQSGVGYLVSQDGRAGSLGISLGDVIAVANEAHKKIKSTIIILDSCHSGALGQAPGVLAEEVASVGKGVILLSASHKDGYAEEKGGRGVFTDIFLDGLRGSAADVLGNITPAAVYSLVDQTLGSWGQRPIFKANVQYFVSLRTVSPKVPPEVLRKLPQYFPDETSTFPLDPTYEPDRSNIPVKFRHLPVDANKTAVFKELQKCNRFGLVVPVDAEHMYDAAIESTGCRLTALGAHYRRLAELKRI